MNSTISKLLTNKSVLNVILVLAVFNVIGYIVVGNINAVLYFIIFAVLIRYFSKNMIIILGIPLILVNLLVMKGNIMEGMENNTDKDENKPDENQKNIDKLVKNTKSKPEPKTGQGLIMSHIENETESNNEENAAQKTGGEQQGFEPGRKKNRGYEIDYATTVEDAYDELNNILGSDGIQRLTSDTQNLMKQQMQLAEAMKGMTPVIKQIGPMVENLKGMMGQMGDGKEGLGGILDLAKKFTSQNA